jgi:hypothetical protein
MQSNKKTKKRRKTSNKKKAIETLTRLENVMEFNIFGPLMEALKKL